MKQEDLDNILNIEKASFPTPWARGIFEMELNSKRSYQRVSRIDDEVVGYIVAWKMHDEIHILNVAVHPKFRNMGIAKKLIKNCIDYFIEKRMSQAILEVRTSNLAAINLYQKLGFKPVRIRRGYYRDTGEDAIVMKLDMV